MNNIIKCLKIQYMLTLQSLIFHNINSRYLYDWSCIFGEHIIEKTHGIIKLGFTVPFETDNMF